MNRLLTVRFLSSHFPYFILDLCTIVLVSLLKVTLLYADIRNWIRNIEQHASDNVNKILVGNKADMDESKRVILHQASFFWSQFDPPN